MLERETNLCNQCLREEGIEGIAQVEGVYPLAGMSAIYGDHDGPVSHGACSRSLGGGCGVGALGGTFLEATEAQQCWGTASGGGRGWVKRGRDLACSVGNGVVVGAL